MWVGRSVAGLAVLLVLAGCASKEADNQPPQATSTSQSPARTSVKLALNWLPEMEHGGFYAALVHGYYADAGLDVEILPGGPNAPVAPMVAGKQVDFGIENADRILMFRAQQAEITGLMAPLQVSPRCLMMHADSGIEGFNDVKNVTLAMSSAAPWAAFLRKTLPLENVEIVPNPGSLALFLDNKKFVQQGYIFSEPILAEKQGAKTRSLMVSDLGFNPYTSVLIARSELVEKNPDLVRRMVQASMKGWRKYLEDPAESHRKIAELNPQMPLDVLDQGFVAMKPLCLGEKDSPETFGRMTAERWKTLANQLVDCEVIKPDSVDPETAYTNSFLEETTATTPAAK